LRIMRREYNLRLPDPLTEEANGEGAEGPQG